MKNLIMSITLIAIIFAGCEGGGGSSGGGGGGGSSSATAAAAAVTSEPVAPTPNPNQISIVSGSSSSIYLRSNENATLSFVINDPLNNSKCTWRMIVGAVDSLFGTLNGNCNAYVHNQYNSLDWTYIVYVNNGETVTSYQWNIYYTTNAPNNGVSASAVEPAAGNVRVYDTKTFYVDRTDIDGDGACSWTLDTVQVSTSCYSYKYTQADGNAHDVVFTITDGVHAAATVSWVAKPAAKIASLTPTSAGIANGASQLYTATLTNPNSVTTYCKWKIDGVTDTVGACTYNYTRSDASVHAISADVVYNVGGTDENLTPSTSYANLPANQGVSITSYTPASDKLYYAEGATSVTIGLQTWSDPDGDAWVDWYINNVKTDCDTSSLCNYTNPGLHNGIEIANYTGEYLVLKAVLTDGQYSASRSWIVQLDHSELNAGAAVGTKCRNQGTTFTVYGRGLESSDTFTIQNQNVVLDKIQVNSLSATLRLPQQVLTGNQAIRVNKGGVLNTTVSNYVTFTNDPLVCN